MDIAKKYQKLSPVEHVMKRPGMYIGGIEEIEDDIWILQNDKIIEKTINYNPGLYKIFDEIIVNAYDQTIRDPTVSIIKVEIDKENNTISVFNDGKGIDVVMHPKEKIYVPELIFGHLRTSTSFSDDKVRITGGIHGLGAKLTAIFSTYLKVEVGDPVNKKSFMQIYKNNLSFKSKPIVKNYVNSSGYVKLTFVPDLKYFKVDKLSDDFIGLLNRRVYDLAALTRKNVNVFLNKMKIPIKSFSTYVNLFDKDDQVIEMCDPSSEKFDQKRWKIIVTLSDGKFKQTSFVNGIYTSHGGRHVDYIVNRLVKELKDYISKKYKTSRIGSQFIKDQMHIFISSVIENPSFSSQIKDELVTPVSKFGSTCEISTNFVKKFFKKFDFDSIIKSQIKYFQATDLQKLDKKKKSKIKGIKKLYDANYAGTRKSKQCILILTEGDSAKATAISGLSAIPKGNNIYGVFPLKGKLLNVREASHKQIINNKEFINLKKIIGLSTKKIYDENNISELRYGSIMLMMDADVDGSHIKGLFINLIHYYWPSLLKIKGFIKVFITPIVKVTYKNKIESFYTNKQYEDWKKKTQNYDKWNVKYYKGLGTNTSEEAKQYFKNLDEHLIDLNWVESSDDSIKLAFSKDKADERKEWLKEYDKDDIIDFSIKHTNYKDFINKELIHFSNYDNIRSIPSVMDGLKPSQRKVLYGSFKRNLINDIKVAQLVGYISEHTSYHHGETSLANTIIGMAQNFKGSNNINFLVPKGQFGSIINGGKDHSSPRYIFTKLEEVTRLIFHKDDDPLLNYLNDDGLMIEPNYYIPIIPTILINGTEGIGTGYSTYIPKFNPLDIIEIIKSKINDQKYKKIRPWYNKYNGDIIEKEKNIYLTKGKYEIKENILRITELPITSWTENYKIFLETTIAEKKYIKSVFNNSTESTIDFTIKFHEAKILNDLNNKKMNSYINELEKLFGLVRVINMNNMHLYDSEGKIKKYKSVNSIINEFYKIRLDFYDKRKKYILNKLKNEIDILASKVKFINLIINKKINIFNKKKDDVIKILDKQSLHIIKDEPKYDYLIRMSFYSFTKEKIDELTKKLNEKKKEYDNINKKKIEEIWIDDLDNLESFIKKNQSSNVSESP